GPVAGLPGGRLGARGRVLRYVGGRAPLVPPKFFTRVGPQRMTLRPVAFSPSPRTIRAGPMRWSLRRCRPLARAPAYPYNSGIEGKHGTMSQSLSQTQFGRNAAEYLTSRPHAQGKSLDRLVALTQPRPDWHALDVATGAGHTAYACAPHVARVWATDITAEMLALVRAEITKRKLGNMRTAHAKAEALPFEDGVFDLVTCRIAPHHFDSIADFLDETRRVLN